jgi:hypothetical protein
LVEEQGYQQIQVTLQQMVLSDETDEMLMVEGLMLLDEMGEFLQDELYTIKYLL